jgi:large-conductance mechanosensitive channel
MGLMPRLNKIKDKKTIRLITWAYRLILLLPIIQMLVAGQYLGAIAFIFNFLIAGYVVRLIIWIYNQFARETYTKKPQTLRGNDIDF